MDTWTTPDMIWCFAIGGFIGWLVRSIQAWWSTYRARKYADAIITDIHKAKENVILPLEVGIRVAGDIDTNCIRDNVILPLK